MAAALHAAIRPYKRAQMLESKGQGKVIMPQVTQALAALCKREASSSVRRAAVPRGPFHFAEEMNLRLCQGEPQ